MGLAATVIEGQVPGGEAWSRRALRDLLSVPRVKGVLVSDGAGNCIESEGRSLDTNAVVVDILIGAVVRATTDLGIGGPQLMATLCKEGVLVVGCGPAVRVAVLADNEANLGSLLNHVRRIFSEGV